jgi:hypothetical protein
MTPKNFPYPLFLKKTRRYMALSTPPVACSFIQVCSLSPNGATNLQQQRQRWQHGGSAAAARRQRSGVSAAVVAWSVLQEQQDDQGQAVQYPEEMLPLTWNLES